MNDLLVANSVSKYFGDFCALNKVSIAVPKGTIFGLLGPNGAGKTTLFRCISGLENYKGNITSDYNKLKDHLGLLLTEPFFFSKITGKEYIRLLANTRQKKLTNIEDKNIFDLPLNQYASTYSTGMKKKLAITAILLQENECFILDEPFNGVDIQSNIVLTEIILKLKALHKTVLVSSHIFSTLSDTCDQIYFLRKGEQIKSVQKVDFKTLEQEMKETTIGNRIEKLELK